MLVCLLVVSLFDCYIRCDHCLSPMDHPLMKLCLALTNELIWDLIAGRPWRNLYYIYLAVVLDIVFAWTGSRRLLIPRSMFSSCKVRSCTCASSVELPRLNVFVSVHFEFSPAYGLTVRRTSSLVLGQRPIACRPILEIAHSQWAASGPHSQWAASGRVGRPGTHHYPVRPRWLSDCCGQAG